MTAADVNVPELAARAAEDAWHTHQGQMLTEGTKTLATRHDHPHIDAMLDTDPDDPEDMAAGVLVTIRPTVERMIPEALSAVLRYPEVVAGIAGVLYEADPLPDRPSWADLRAESAKWPDGIARYAEARALEQAQAIVDWLAGGAR